MQAASVEQQASGSMAGLLGAPETSRRLLAGRVRAPRLSSHSALPGIWGVSQEQPVITWGGGGGGGGGAGTPCCGGGRACRGPSASLKRPRHC